MRAGSIYLLAMVLAALPCAAQAQIVLGQPKAVDGDTLDFGGSRTRLFGIDAPEYQQTCKRNGEVWACGKEAQSVLADLIAGKQVRCSQNDIDTYGRIVATCTADGLDLSEVLATAGLAIALSHFTDRYVENEARARANRVGIWASEFQLPADYRATNADFRAQEQRWARTRQQELAAPPRQTRSPIIRANVYFRSCREAWAAGAAPLYRGSPGYRAEMDGDGDGVACEPIRNR